MHTHMRTGQVGYVCVCVCLLGTLNWMLVRIVKTTCCTVLKALVQLESGAREFAIPAGWRATETHSLAGKKTDNCHGFRSGAMRYDMMMTAPTRTHEHQRSEKHQRIEFGWRAAKRRRWLVWPVHGRGGNTTERQRWYFISRVATSRGATVKQCDRFVSLRFEIGFRNHFERLYRFLRTVYGSSVIINSALITRTSSIKESKSRHKPISWTLVKLELHCVQGIAILYYFYTSFKISMSQTRICFAVI